MIVNSGGENIVPSRVEALLTIEPEIEQAMVDGDQAMAGSSDCTKCRGPRDCRSQ